ncbi:HNH endonuclease signature motif containing protein [Streptomyces sp. NPDC090025]|uniref:HNH endonuclease signature motif containing protein n=1 Tax=Streptomyces sp. NPDC090025 TaxID=3365922 RepID=UPI0038344F73
MGTEMGPGSGTGAFTREQLEAAVRGARTLSEALERLGVDPRSGTRRYVRDRLRGLGVDVSHFEREGVRWTRDVLVAAVAVSGSVSEVVHRLGLDVVGGHQAHIGRRIKAYGIDTSHFTSAPRTGPDGRGGPGTRRRVAADVLVADRSPDARRVPGRRLKRALMELGVEERCAMCGCGAVWLGDPLPLEVDHIDGDWRDNRAENLRLLCPNCHSTTDTYRGRGKGRSRSGAGGDR